MPIFIGKYPIHRDCSQGNPLAKIFYLYRIYGIKELDLKTSAAGLKEDLCFTLTSCEGKALAFSVQKKPLAGIPGARRQFS